MQRAREIIDNLEQSNHQPPKFGYAHQSTGELGTPEKSPARIRQITIQEVDRGYIVSVACQTLVVESAHELIAALSMYITKPAEAEKLYIEGKLFSK